MGCCLKPTPQNEEPQKNNQKDQESQSQNSEDFKVVIEEAGKNELTTEQSQQGKQQGELGQNDGENEKDSYSQLQPLQISNSAEYKKSFLAIQLVHLNPKDFFELYKLQNILGSGAFGKVYLAEELATGTKRAVKTIDINFQYKEYIEKILKEVEIVQNIDHPNVMQIIEYFMSDNKLYIVCELYTGGELFYELRKQRIFSESIAAQYLQQILSGIAILHENCIMHRDIKPENLLLQSADQKNILKLVDFGTAKRFEIKNQLSIQKRAGTLYYMSPEMLLDQYNEKCDIWSAGIVLYILLSGRPPFFSKNQDLLIHQIKTKEIDLQTLPVWQTISSDGKDLLLQMLERDVDKRISAKAALNHPWIQQSVMNKSEALSFNKDVLEQLDKFQVNEKLQQLVWMYMASLYTCQDSKKIIEEQFIKIDTDGDGELTRQELIDGLKELGNSNQKTIFDDLTVDQIEEKVDNIIKIADTNKDGKIQYQEFVTACLSMEQEITDEKLEATFKRIDLDGNEQLSIEELQYAFCGTDELNSEIKEKWTRIITSFDENQDGQISMSEFKNMMSQLKTAWNEENEVKE